MITSIYEKVKLGDVVTLMHQGINTAADKVEYVDSGVPIIQSKHFTSGTLNLDDSKCLGENDVLKYAEKYTPKLGDILFSNIGTVGKSVVLEEPPEFMFAWNVFLIRLNSEKAHNRYIKHFFDYLLSLNVYERWFTGGTVKFLNKKTMAEIEIPLPPLEEQKRIAAILDKADSVRRKRQQAIDLADDFLRSVFLDMFGDPVTNPKGWEVKKWNDVLKIVNGKNQKTVLADDGKYPIMGSGGEMGRATEYLTPENSVIIGRKGNINKPILVKEKFWNVDTAFGLVPNKELISHNFLYWFCVFFNFEKLNKTVTIPSLTKADLLEIKIPVPDLTLINKFDAVVKKLELTKALKNKSHSESNNAFNSLSQKAFAGEL